MVAATNRFVGPPTQLATEGTEVASLLGDLTSRGCFWEYWAGSQHAPKAPNHPHPHPLTKLEIRLGALIQRSQQVFPPVSAPHCQLTALVEEGWVVESFGNPHFLCEAQVTVASSFFIWSGSGNDFPFDSGFRV